MRRNRHILVDYGLANLTVPADLHAVEQDGTLDDRVAVDAHIRRQDAPAHVTARDDATLTDHAIVRLAPADMAPRTLVAEDKLGRRQLRLVRADRPFIVVQIEHRIDLDQ